MKGRASTLTITGLSAALALAGGSGLAAQQNPMSDVVIAGYGTANYASVIDDDAFENDFTASLSPIVLYSMGSDFLFEAEAEIGFEGSETSLAVEYAQIDYLGFDRVQLVAGKFLLPFGVFSERLHPSWINKMPSMPLLYGHAHGGVAEGALLPVLSDVGAMARYTQPVGGTTSLNLSLWVTQGPEAVAPGEEDDHEHAVASGGPGVALASVPGHDEEPEEPGAGTAEAASFSVPGVAFGTAFSDNNDSKMLGARLGLVSGGSFEVYASGFHAMYDEGDFLDLYGGNVSAEWRRGDFELRGELAALWQEFERDGEFPTLTRPGYYLQAARRIGDFEPVVRWSHLLDSRTEGETFREETRQMAFGLNYWLFPSVPLKAAFEWNLDADERLLVQWAYGF